MLPLLYGLQVDYVTRNGHFMVMSGPDGLIKEELSLFQINMLLANKIPHLLDLQLEERDQQIQLYYNITGKRMLTHMLRMGSLSIQQFFSLLYAVVDVVGESHIYMLQEGRYVLKEDFIYCGDNLTDVHLTYIPKNSLSEKNSLSVDLQHLASRLIHKVSELSGNGYQELMNYLMDESFNIPMLKQLLMKHRNRLGTPEQRQIVPPMKRPEQNEQPELLPPSVRDTAQPAAIMNNSPVMASSITPPAFSPSWFEEDDSHELSERNRKMRLPVQLAGLVAICLIWKLYVDYSQEGWLYICSGLSLLTLDIIFAVLWIWKPVIGQLSANPLPNSSEALFRPFFPSAPAGPVSSFQQSYTQESDLPNATVPKAARLDNKLHTIKAEPVVDQENIASYYHNLQQRTTMLAPTDATMLLSAAELQLVMQAAAPCPSLEWTWNGEKKSVRIDKTPFVIGRSGQAVHYEHPETGVSRIHAEIMKDSGQFSLKDLGSRNGTIINGKILVPYRMYSLEEGDIVKIINTEFVFKMGL